MDFRGPGWKQICRRVEPQEFSGNGDGNGVARLGCLGWLEFSGRDESADDTGLNVLRVSHVD